MNGNYEMTNLLATYLFTVTNPAHLSEAKRTSYCLLA